VARRGEALGRHDSAVAHVVPVEQLHRVEGDAVGDPELPAPVQVKSEELLGSGHR
jgi:hypothetical protein